MEASEPGSTDGALSVDEAAARLQSLYDKPFGGKPRGKFRIAARHLRQLMGRRRIYPEDVVALSRALGERGFVLIDMDVFFVVVSVNTFTNYRRVKEESVR